MATPRKARKVTARTIDYAQRRRDALIMRATRATYQQIADKYYNGSRPQAYRDIQKAFDDLPKEAAEEVRRQELELLDIMARGLMTRAAKGDDKAVASLLNIMTRRAKYLGLDTPVQIEATSVEGAAGFPIMVNPALLSPEALAAMQGQNGPPKE